MRQRIPIRQVSKKQAAIKAQLKRVYAQIEAEREHKCTGCGTPFGLSHSHLISRARRPDLVTVKENITYHCLDQNGNKGCHTIWEHGTIAEKRTLQDFSIIMNYIGQTDPEYYQILMNK